MDIMKALKGFLASEDAQYQAFVFALGNTSLQIKACEEIQAEINRKLEEQPETQSTQAYISALQKMVYWYYMNLPKQIIVDMYIQSGRLAALEFAIAELGKVPKIEHEIAQTERLLPLMIEKRGEYSSPHLSYTGYLEALIEVKELIEQTNNQ